MKKWIAVLMILAITLGLCSAWAEEEDPQRDYALRHNIYTDVSRFEIPYDGQYNHSEQTGPNEATVGTDFYLWVDPDTASYVTFIVVDENGDPLKEAAIYLTVNGITEFFGLTDEDGKFSAYIFRDVEYQYRIEKYGYQTVEGRFTAREETKTIRVVLQKYHSLDVIIRYNGQPVEGVTVIVNNKELVTGKNGSVRYWLTNGQYTGRIILPNGAEKIVTIQVQGDTVYVLDIYTSDAFPPELRAILEAGFGDSDMFIVFDKHYAPEDYDLTMNIFTDDELQLPDGLTDEQREEAIARWHELNPDHLLVVAEPNKVQDTPDRIIMRNGQPLWAQRSLILGGRQLLNIEAAGMPSILFENEDLGVWLDIADLYSPKMAKLYHLIHTKHHDVEAYTNIRLANLTVEGFDFNAMPEVWRWVDDPDQRVLSMPDMTEAMFAASRLEVRITPLLASDVVRAVLGLEPYMEEDSLDEVLLISPNLRMKWMRDYLADGHVTETEYHELTGLAVDSKAYRVQVLVNIDGREVNVTDILPSLQVRLNVDEAIEAQAQAYAGSSGSAAQDEAESIAAYPEDRVMRTVRSNGVQFDSDDYYAGLAVREAGINLRNGLPAEDEAHYDAIMAALDRRTVDVFDVDVRHKAVVFRNVHDVQYFAVVDIHRNVDYDPEPEWTVYRPDALAGMYVIRMK